MDDLERTYRDLLAQIATYPMTEAGRAAIPAEIERQYRTEREERQAGEKRAD